MTAAWTKRAGVLAIILLGAAILWPGGAAAYDLEVGSSLNWGPVKGYLQTPAGGTPGTSDIKRPTLEELNIDDATFGDYWARVTRGRHRLEVGTQLIQLSESRNETGAGTGTLAEPLMSRTLFSAGEAFRSEVSFDWYRAGYAYGLVDREQGWSLWPRVEFAMLDFIYELETDDTTIERSYSKFTPRLGGELSYRWGGGAEISLDLASSIPVSNTPTIMTAMLEGSIPLYSGDLLKELRLFAGTGWLYIDYEDNQELPNHLRLETTPRLTVGLKGRF